jgi:predicted phosphodiesterase
MSLRDEFTKAVQAQEELTARKRKWIPGVEWLGSEGTITTDAVVGEPEWADILRKWDLDPDEFQIVEPVLFNSWGGEEGVNNRQFKAKVVRRVHSKPDIEPLISAALRHKPKKRKYEGSAVLNVVLADWQIGKADHGGVEETLSRIVAARDALIDRARELRKIGRPIASLNVLWTGDSIEGCLGHYPSQTFSVELDRREQVKITRRLLTDSLQAWSKHFEEITVAAVAGNHGENRNGGKGFTGVQDNDDLAIVEQVAEILAANPDAFGHVRFAVARDALTLTVPAAGWIVGITHGHIASRGSNVEQKLQRWWEGQAAGRQPIGDADILITGHYHHLRIADWGGCLWLQAPAMEGGSEWWRLATGQLSQIGTLTFVTTEEQRATDIAVLGWVTTGSLGILDG